MNANVLKMSEIELETFPAAGAGVGVVAGVEGECACATPLGSAVEGLGVGVA
jgi:hypothetical protein